MRLPLANKINMPDKPVSWRLKPEGPGFIWEFIILALQFSFFFLKTRKFDFLVSSWLLTSLSPQVLSCQLHTGRKAIRTNVGMNKCSPSFLLIALKFWQFVLDGLGILKLSSSLVWQQKKNHLLLFKALAFVLFSYLSKIRNKQNLKAI